MPCVGRPSQNTLGCEVLRAPEDRVLGSPLTEQGTGMANFLALFMGSVEANKRGEASPPTPQQIGEGMAAWGKWMDDHSGAIVDSGGPLGKTKKASPEGISDTTNFVAGYVIVSADSHRRRR